VDADQIFILVLVGLCVAIVGWMAVDTRRKEKKRTDTQPSQQ
jgi:hypothetical protein